MITIFLVQVDPEITSLLQQDAVPDEEMRIVDEPDAAIAQLEAFEERQDGAGAAVLVLGAGLPDPVQLAQRLHRVRSGLPVVVLCAPGTCEERRQEIQFSPFLGSTVVCEPAADRRAVVQTVRQMARRARQRRQYEAAMGAVQRKLTDLTASPGSAKVYLDTLLKHAPIGVVVVDDAAQILAWNRQAGTIFGLSEQEALGRTLPDLFSPPDRERLRRALARGGQATHRTAPELFERVDADGVVQLIEVTATTLSGEQARLGTMVLLQDVTSRIRAEEKARQLSEQVAVATALARQAEELKQLNRALEQRNRELQEFTYVASHDLQEPLRKIHAFSDLLREDYKEAVDEEGQFYLERIEDAALRMSRLLSDLLTYSRVVTKARPFEAVDLNEILNDVRTDLGVLLDESGGTLEAAELPTIEADPTQMYQLFQNLIANALKFRREDVPPRVEVKGTLETGTAQPAGPEEEICRLEVRDNGIGFEEKYLDRIFSPFQRLHTRANYAGTGMGLAICRRIAERHGGTITARSRPGAGSTFIVTLPARHG